MELENLFPVIRLLGSVIVLLSIIPTLYNINAITFNIPSYPIIVNYFIQLLAGIFMFLAIMLIGD